MPARSRNCLNRATDAVCALWGSGASTSNATSGAGMPWTVPAGMTTTSCSPRAYSLAAAMAAASAGRDDVGRPRARRRHRCVPHPAGQGFDPLRGQAPVGGWLGRSRCRAGGHGDQLFGREALNRLAHLEFPHRHDADGGPELLAGLRSAQPELEHHAQVHGPFIVGDAVYPSAGSRGSDATHRRARRPRSCRCRRGRSASGTRRGARVPPRWPRGTRRADRPARRARRE